MTNEDFLAEFACIADAPEGVARLRRLVLDLAVSGRLNAREAGDQTASDLLERISQERDQLVAKKTIRRGKPLKDVPPEEEFYSLPSGWAWVRLGEFADIVRGVTFPGSAKSESPREGHVACLRSGNIQGSIRWSDLVYIPDEYVKKQAQLVLPNDIIMSIANSRELVGKIAVADDCIPERAAIGGFLAAIRPFETETRRYLAIALQASVSRDYWLEHATQTTNIANISSELIRTLPVAIPPLSEQVEIVARVHELLQICDELQDRRARAEELLSATVRSALSAIVDSAARDEGVNLVKGNLRFALGSTSGAADVVGGVRGAILALAVRGRLVPQNRADESADVLLEHIAEERGRLIAEKVIKQNKHLEPVLAEEEPYEIPGNWRFARLREVTVDCGQRIPDEPFTYIDVSSIDSKRGDLMTDATRVLEPEAAPSRARKVVEPGVVIYSTVRPNLRKVVHLSVLPSPTPIVSTAFAVLKPLSGIEPRFIYFVMRSPMILEQTEKLMRGVAYPALNDASISTLCIPVPPLAEQKRIVARLDALMALCDELEDAFLIERRASEEFAENAVASLLQRAA